MRAYLFLPMGAFALAGCNSILGIDDHQLASDAASRRDASIDAASDGSPADSTTDGTGQFVDGGGQADGADATTGKDGSLDGAREAKAADSATDSAMSDDGSTDGATDTGATDSAPEDAAPVDGGPDAPVESGCQTSSTRCSFNGVQTCTAGSWSKAVACSADLPQCVDGGCGLPQSCISSTTGTSNCGAGATASETCCSSPEITPGGEYYRTYTTGADGGVTGTPADPADVSAVRLDKYLITVGRFRQYVNYLVGGGALPADLSGKHTHLNGGHGLINGASDAAVVYETGWDVTWNLFFPRDVTLGPLESQWNSTLTSDTCTLDGGGTQSYATWTPTPGQNENLPINCIDWYDAYAFCIWDGGFLPSEAEWEFVAAGGDQQRQYPWGSTAPGTSSQYAIYGCLFPDASATCSGVENIASVGTASLGAGLWSQLDLAGELGEWNLDTWSATYANPCSDCAYLAPTAERVWRSGAFGATAAAMVPTQRNHFTPLRRGADVGARCARVP